MANELEFDSNYSKLCNQAHAQLVWCEKVFCNPEDIKYKSLVEYDTRKRDGTYYKIRKASYLLLLFVGDKGIMFSTLRTPDTKNINNFCGKEGSLFDILIKDGKDCAK